ncbi:galactose oxidase [Rhizophagus irregularis]|uniref:Galactose oxidase n=1 Tax=Rhizophagus irregularis TaxID=588596 RepID=A0A2I1G101_9GLOM|nr:galactose oxidase [Rhizophagus irregularis]
MGGVVPLPEPIISDFFYLDTSVLSSTDSTTLPWTELTGLDNLFTSSGTAVAGGANKDLFILFGGNMTPAENSSLVIVYYTNNNTWSKPVISAPQGEPARKRKTQAVVDSAGKMYIFGGSTSPEPDISLVNDMFILDTINWSWSTGTQDGAPDARSDFSATILSNGFIVYIGGSNINNRYVPMSQINMYDTNSAAWVDKEATGEIPSPRGGHSAVLTSDERIIIYGGAVSISADGKYTASSPDLAILDTTNNNFVWSQPKASGTAPPQIAYHSASLVGDYMIVSFGNITNKGSSPDVYALDTKDKGYKWITSINTNTLPGTNSGKSSNVGLIAGLSVGGIVVLILLGGGLFWFYRNKKVMEEVIETPGEFTDAGFNRRYESMNSATTSQISHDFSRHSTSANTESDPSREFHPSYSHNFPVQHDPEIDDDDDKEFRVLPKELQPEYLEKKFNNNDNI